MILCSVILRAERRETEPGWQMAGPKSETRNHKNLRLIQAMPERLSGWQGEDRMRKLEYVTSEKFPTTLCSDKVNKQRGPTTGSLQEPQLCHHQDQQSHNPWSGKGSTSCPELACPPCPLSYKNIETLPPSSVRARVDAQLDLQPPPPPGGRQQCWPLAWWTSQSCQGPGWHKEIQHTTQTTVKTSSMSTPLSLLRLFKIKQTAIEVLRVVMKWLLQSFLWLQNQN